MLEGARRIALAALLVCPALAQVRMIGAVARPVELTGETVLDCVALGGLTDAADIRALLVARGDDEPPVRIDVERIFRTGDGAENLTVRAGDVILVPWKGATEAETKTLLDALVLDGVERRRAIHDLCYSSAPTPYLLQVLLLCLDDGDPRIVGEAVTTLGAITDDPARVEARVRALTEHTDAEVRVRAAAALRGMRSPR